MPKFSKKACFENIFHVNLLTFLYTLAKIKASQVA